VDVLAVLYAGRVEEVPMRDHWESVYAAAQVPLARGWERQVDTDRNALFYRDVLSPQDYVAWLRANAVTYVVIAPSAVPDRYARTESALVLNGLPELRPVWQDDTWRLYEVTDAQQLVSAPAELARSDRGGVTVRVPARADVLVRVHWSRWLSVRQPGACLAPGPDGWTELRVTTPGEFRLTSSLRPGPAC
ncbi:MFS transporter, partial [Actinoplanes sp. NPDC048791]